MSVAKAAVYAAVPVDPHPVAVLSGVNRTLAQLFGEYSSFIAVFHLIYADAGARRLPWPGWRQPGHFRSQGPEALQRGRPALPLGVAEATKCEALAVEMAPGDAAGVLYGRAGQRPRTVAASSTGTSGSRPRNPPSRSVQFAAELCAAIHNDLQSPCRDRTREDDLTLACGPGGGIAGVEQATARSHPRNRNRRRLGPARPNRRRFRGVAAQEHRLYPGTGMAPLRPVGRG